MARGLERLLLVLALTACSDEPMPEDPAAGADAAATSPASGMDGGEPDGSASSGPPAAGHASFDTTYEMVETCGEPLPDPGDDACLACALAHCCEGPASSCYGENVLAGGDCYGQLVGTFRDCFEEEVAAGSNTESWYIVAECSDTIFQEEYDDFDAAGPGSFPFDDNPLQELVECIVGSRPASADRDGGAADAGRPLLERGLPLGFYYEENCAEECFPSWR